jgi:hypothetical protein
VQIAALILRSNHTSGLCGMLQVMLKLALKLMRASVKRKAGADINAVSPLDVVGGSLIPAMFGHGREDSFIPMHHSGEARIN